MNTILVIVVYLYGVFSVYEPAIILGYIIKGLGITEAIAGWLVSIVLICMGSFGMISGNLLKKIGIKKSFFLGIVILMLGHFFNYAVTGLTLFVISRIIIGIGIALIITVSSSIVLAFYSEKGREKMNTIFGMIHLMGYFVAALVMVPILNAVGGMYQSALGVTGFAGLILAIGWMIFGKDGEIVDEVSDAEETESNIFKTVWKYPAIKIICFTYLITTIPYMQVTTFLPYYLNNDFSLDLGTAANLATIMPVAGIVGGLLGGVVMSISGRRKAVVVLTIVLQLIGMGLMVIPTVIWAVIGASLLALGSAGMMPALFTIPMELKGMTPARVAVAMALFYAFGLILSAFGPLIGGYIAEVASFRSSFIATGGLLIICFPILTGLTETRPLKQKNEN